METETETERERWVVVCTGSRPWLVVCGRLVAQDDDFIELADARCAVYYSPAMRGVMGLASHGPDDACRISRPCPRIRLRHETVMDATAEAVARWEAEPWS